MNIDTGDFVSEYTAARDHASLALTVAYSQGLIGSDKIAEGSAARYLELNAQEKAALAPSRIVELGKHTGDLSLVAETYRAAFALGGVAVPERTKRLLAGMKARSAIVDTPEARAAALNASGINV